MAKLSTFGASKRLHHVKVVVSVEILVLRVKVISARQ